MEKKKKKRVALLFKPVRVFLYSVETSSRMAEGPLFSVGNLIRRQELLYTTRVYFIYIGKVKEQREKGEKLTQAHDEQDEISMFAKKWNRRRRRKKTLFPREGRVLLSFEMSLNNSTPRWRQYVSGSNRSPFDLPLSLSLLWRANAGRRTHVSNRLLRPTQCPLPVAFSQRRRHTLLLWLPSISCSVLSFLCDGNRPGKE